VTFEPSARLASLGWDAQWAAAFAAERSAASPSSTETTAPARVVAEHRGRYVVGTEAGDRSAVLAGRLRHAVASREELPTTGDWVAVSIADGDGTTTIHTVLPRRSAFVRKAAGETTEAQVVAANVDVALIATALPADVSTRRLDRYLTLAWESGAMPVVVLTKADLSDDVASALADVRAAVYGTDVIAVSATTGEGLEALLAYLRPARTAVLLGSSGVGKSTLVNRLLGNEHLRTATVRDDGRGRHTTTHRELVTLANGALLVDTPGMRELQLWSADGGFGTTFADVDALADGCRFRDCAHAGEPGCAVAAAVADGRLAAERLEHWHQLRRELAYLARKQDEAAAAADRARTRSLTRAARARINEKYGRRDT